MVRGRDGRWTITATGLVSAAGDEPGAVLDALERRRPVPREASGDGPDAPALAPIAGFDPRAYLDRKGLKHLSRTSQLACAAASRLARDLDGVRPERVGVALGSAWATLETIVRFERAAHVEGFRFVDPGLFAETVANVPAGQVSIAFGWAAFNATLASGPVSGLAALDWAVEWLEESRADVAVAGGSDELNRYLVAALAAGNAELPRPPRVAGEGACLVAVESAEHALGRGAAPLARLAAVATADDASIGARAALVGELLDEAALAAGELDAVILGGEPGPDAGRETMPARWGIPAATPLLVPADVLGETWSAAGPIGLTLAMELLRRDRAVNRVLLLEASRGEHVAGAIVEAPDAAETGRPGRT